MVGAALHHEAWWQGQVIGEPVIEFAPYRPDPADISRCAALKVGPVDRDEDAGAALIIAGEFFPPVGKGAVDFLRQALVFALPIVINNEESEGACRRVQPLQE